MGIILGKGKHPEPCEEEEKGQELNGMWLWLPMQRVVCLGSESRSTELTTGTRRADSQDQGNPNAALMMEQEEAGWGLTVIVEGSSAPCIFLSDKEKSLLDRHFEFK